MHILNFLSVLILYATPVFTSEKGFDYTEEEVAAAQDKIEKEMPAEIRHVLYESPPSNYVERIRGETLEFRQKMIEFARKMAYPLPGCTEHTWEQGLFMYRDEATVRKFVSKWFDEGDMTNYGNYLNQSANPEVIRLAGPYLFDGAIIPESHNYHSPLPIAKNEELADVLCQGQAIASCVEFPEAVRIWNRRLAATGPPMKTELVILQRWWKENEAAFQAREYGKVKPGVLSIPGMERSVLGYPPNFETADTETPSSTATPPPAPTDKPKPANTASSPQSFTPTSALLGAATLALLTGLFIYWKRRT